MQDIDSKHLQQQAIYKFLRKKSLTIQKIVKLKLLGYKNNEIAKELRISRRKIENRFSYFLKAFRNSEYRKNTT
jgi:DNA-binding NarL/FixJ family response regulator